MRAIRRTASMLLLLAPTLSSAQTNVANGVRFKTLEVSNAEWPVASVSTEFAGYVTVVAITPGVDRIGVQVLWPRTPADTGWLLAEQARRLLPFSFDATSHRVATGGADRRPIIVGLHSPKRPNLDAFIRGGGWAKDAVIKVQMDSTTELLDVLGAVIYGENARFAVNLFREIAPVGAADRRLRALGRKRTSRRNWALLLKPIRSFAWPR